jgi:hypothetical protein
MTGIQAKAAVTPLGNKSVREATDAPSVAEPKTVSSIVLPM